MSPLIITVTVAWMLVVLALTAHGATRLRRMRLREAQVAESRRQEWERRNFPEAYEPVRRPTEYTLLYPKD